MQGDTLSEGCAEGFVFLEDDKSSVSEAGSKPGERGASHTNRWESRKEYAMTDHAKTGTQIKLNKNTKGLRVCRDKRIINDFEDNVLRCHRIIPAEDNEEITLPSPSAFQTTT